MIRSEVEFADYCLERLGAPVIQINVDPVHVTAAITEALQKFWDHHRDGSTMHYYVYSPTMDDVIEGTCPAPKDVDNVLEVVGTETIGGIGAWHTPSWQAANSIMTGHGSYARISLVDFTMLKQRISDINHVLGSVYPFTYKKYARKIECRFALEAGSPVVFECFKNVDPRQEGMEEAWNDLWLKKYATALIKKRWADILMAAQGIKLPSGIELDGASLLAEAKEEIQELEEELRKVHSDPVDFFMG